MKDLIAKVERLTEETRRYLADRAAREIPKRTNSMVESVLHVARESRATPAPLTDATPKGGA